MPIDDPSRVEMELKPVVRNKEFDSTEIEQKLESGEIHLSLLLASTKVELILAETVKEALSLSEERFNQIGFDRWTLGTYIERVKKLNRIIEEEIKEYRLRELVTKRNRLAHDDGYAKLLETDQEEHKEVKQIVEKVTEFVDKVIIDGRRNEIIHSS